jgi:hypothetical protein
VPRGSTRSRSARCSPRRRSPRGGAACSRRAGICSRRFERQPYSVDAWTRLSRIALQLADREGAQRAATRALELDPGDAATAAFARRAQGLLAPGQASATATGTPLPPAPGAAGLAPDPATTPAPELTPAPEPEPDDGATAPRR